MLNALRLISLFPRQTIPKIFCYSMLKPKHHVDFDTVCYLTVYLRFYIHGRIENQFIIYSKE